MAELKPYRGDYYLWLYIPSTPAAALFTALFSLGTAYTMWRMFKSRTWFCTAFVVGGLRMPTLAAKAVPINLLT